MGRNPTWREILPVHPAADLFPLLSPEELRELADRIAANGLLERVTISLNPDEKPTLLDGRNRLDALELLGCKIFHNGKDGKIDWHHWVKAKNIKDGMGSIIFEIHFGDPIAFIIDKNIHRRHLTSEQKGDLIDRVLKIDPTKSDRQIGEMTDSDHKTVALRRRKAEARGELPHVETRTDTKGRKQPARRRRKGPEPVDHPEVDANAKAAAQEDGVTEIAGLEVHEVTRAADLDATPLSIVGALSVLIKKITEHGLSEKYLPEFLDAQPKFDALDLIELAKRLKDFAGYWEAHERRALKVAKSKPQPWNGKLRWMGGNTAMTPWGTVKIVEGELGYRAVRYIDGDEEAIEDTDRSDRDALEWLKAQVQIWCDKTAAEEASSGPDTTIPADLSIPNFMRRT